MQEVIYILRFIIFFISLLLRTLFSKNLFHWILNTGNHEKSMRRAVGEQSRERHLY